MSDLSPTPPSSEPVADTEREKLANVFDICARGFRPEIFGPNDRKAGPLMTQSQHELIAGLLHAHPQPAAGAEREDDKLAEIAATRLQSPAIDWSLSEESKRAIDEIEANIRNASLNADKLIAGATPHSPVRSTMAGVDPAEIWEEYIKETPRAGRTPQGAIAFAVDRIAALTGGGHE